MAETPEQNGNENPKVHDIPELPDLSDLERRLKGAKEKKAVVEADFQPSAEKRKLYERADAQGLGAGLQIAYAIIGFPVLGFGLGALLDHFLGTAYLRGFIGLAGCILAVVSALILIKQANSQT